MPDIELQTAVKHHRAGRREEAAAIYRALLQKRPNDPEILRLLGFVIAQLGQAAEGAELIQRSIALKPGVGVAHANLAFAYLQMNRLDLAAESYRRALSLTPTMGDVWIDYARVQATRGEDDSAIDAVRKAITIKPNAADLYNYLGVLCRDSERLDASVTAFRKAIELLPSYAEAHHNLALSLDYSGLVEQGVELEAQSSALAPNVPAPAISRLYMLHFHPGFDREAIAREMRLFDEQFTKPLAKDIKPHLNDRNPDRKLKVGYVSPNFYYQAEGYFLLPLLRSHDHANFEIHCYSCVTKPDRTTELFKKSSDVWHEVAFESDETLAKRIYDDRIDILVDLTMHMRDNRLLLFARKPAPVQVTWLAHPGGTGVSGIDYRFTDALLDPEGTDRFYAEKSCRLPDCWCCYDAFSKNKIDYRPRGFIRFASLNTPAKHNESVLRLWARVLGEVPKSRLLLLNLSDDHRRRILEIFAAAGVDNERLEFARYLQRDKYLQSYNEIDVCLDPFPYNGITTTLDALWMGVPVVTLVGQTAPSRASLSILATAGLDEFVARTPDEFVAAAVRAVHHPRDEIREKLVRSPLFDYKRFALNVEAAYREMWRRYVETA